MGKAKISGPNTPKMKKIQTHGFYG